MAVVRNAPQAGTAPNASTGAQRRGVRVMVPEGGLQTIQLRDTDTIGPLMSGHFAVFNRWTEIDSFFEGRFMESIAPGAFKKTFREQRDSMKVLFQHGRDPQIGNKPLGPIKSLSEDDTGARYEVPLLDAPYVRDTLLPGLRAGLYGASFKFRVTREEVSDNPDPSESNPEGIPERTVKEAQVYEFGPVTFPAYADATAGVRSITDDYFLEGLAQADPECVRAATEMVEGDNGRSTFSMFVARQLGIELPQRAEPEPEAPEAPPATGRATAQANAPGCPQDFPHGVHDAGGNLIACHAAMATADYHANIITNPEIGGAVGSNSAEPDPVTSSREAAPEPRATTPLLGVRKEPWRL